MKKILTLFIVALMSVTLYACQSEETVTLPNFEGFTMVEIEEELERLGLETSFIIRSQREREQSNMFIEYGQNYQVGDTVKKGSFVPVIVSATLIDDQEYFTIVDLEYDGPRLDPSFFEIEDYFSWDAADERYVGTGKAYYVDYTPGRLNQGGGCIDGDTTVFTYPSVVLEMIESNTKSVRYFNIDTAETWSGGEEEWGYQATAYVCGLLNEAESYVLQSDPGDGFLDRHGRLLGWVWIMLPEMDDYVSLNYLAVRQGLATVEYEFGAGENAPMIYDGITYNQWMHLGEARAREDELGMHGDLLDWYWDYQNDRPYAGRWGN